MKRIIYILLLFISNLTFGQIEINNQIIPVTGDSLLINNIGQPSDSTSLISVKDIRNNTPLYYEGFLLNDTFNLNIDTNYINIKKGLPLYLKSSNENLQSFYINLNGATYPVIKNNNYPIVGGEVIAEKVCILLFNGNSFIFLNSELPKCPPNFAQPNASYCIEIDERASTTFWNAVTSCNDDGFRLCSWSEWYYACQKTDLGLLNLNNNWEWINNSQNEPTQAKVVGFGKCEITNHRIITTITKYRCCLSY